MQTNYKAEAVKELAAEIKAAGFRVFIAERGTYGFYTDAEGTRVVSFQYDFSGFKFSGNYKATNPHGVGSVGTGWVMGNSCNFQHMFDQYPPLWATKGVSVELATLEQHLKTYQASSRYTEVV